MSYAVEDVIDLVVEYKRNLKERLNSQEFYEMMQEYRHASIDNQTGVSFAFDAIKEFILSAIDINLPSC